MPYKNKNIQRVYQKEYRKNKSSSGMTGQYYQLYKSLLHYNQEEIQVLFKKRKEQCTYAKDNEEIKRLRTEMTIIGNVLEELQHTL